MIDRLENISFNPASFGGQPVSVPGGFDKTARFQVLDNESRPENIAAAGGVVYSLHRLGLYISRNYLFLASINQMSSI